MTIPDFIKKYGITMTATRIGEREEEYEYFGQKRILIQQIFECMFDAEASGFNRMYPLVVKFHQSQVKGFTPPTVEETLEAVLFDIQSIESYLGSEDETAFGDWAHDLGYEMKNYKKARTAWIETVKERRQTMVWMGNADLTDSPIWNEFLALEEEE